MLDPPEMTIRAVFLCHNLRNANISLTDADDADDRVFGEASQVVVDFDLEVDVDSAPCVCLGQTLSASAYAVSGAFPG